VGGVGVQVVLHEPVPTKLAASVVGGSAAGLAERLRRVGLAEDSVGALCQVVSVGDVKEFGQDRDFWDDLRHTMMQNAGDSGLAPNDAEWERFLAALPRIVRNDHQRGGHEASSPPSPNGDGGTCASHSDGADEWPAARPSHTMSEPHEREQPRQRADDDSQSDEVSEQAIDGTLRYRGHPPSKKRTPSAQVLALTRDTQAWLHEAAALLRSSDVGDIDHHEE
jgi:hypothetical protein